MKPQDTLVAPDALLGNRTVLYGGVAAAVLLVVIAALMMLTHLRRQDDMQTAVSTQNLARSMDLTLQGLIAPIEVALLASADEISRQISTGRPDVSSINRYLARQADRLPHVAYFQGVNARGELVYGTDVLAPPVDNSDRDYFVHLKDRPKAGLFIVKPHQAGPSNQWIWSFAQRIDKPDGSFGGVVLAAIAVGEIEGMFARIQMEPGASIALRDADLGLIARHTFNRANPIPIGDKRLSRPFANALKVNPAEGTYVSDATSVDGIFRTYSYRRNARHGFLVNVGIDTETAMADWRKQAWTVAGLVTAFILSLFAYLLLINRSWRHQREHLQALEDSRQALREHDARYREVVEFSSDGFWVIDLDGRVCDVNEAYARRSGYTRDELLRMRVSDLEAKEAPTEITAHMQKISNSGADTFETLHRSKDGEVWPVEISVRNRSDHPGQILGFLRDISARKRAETLLRTRLRFTELAQTETLDRFLQQVLDVAEEVTGSQIGFFHFVDPDQEHLTLQAWSTNTLAHMCTAEGKGQHYAISEAGIWVDAFKARAPVIHNDYAGYAKKKGQPEGHAAITRELVVPIIRKGKVTEIIGVGNKARDYVEADVEALQLIAEMVQDMTDRIRAEAEVRTLSRAMEQSPASVVITDRAGSIEYVNPRFEQVTGYTRSESVGANPRILKSGVVPDEVYAQLWTTILAGNEWRGELCNRRKSGELFWEYAAISGLKNERGEVAHFIAVKEDISERKRAEDSARLANQQLRQLATQLNRMHEAESGLLSRELHDEFGQMLTSIKMDLSWLASRLGEAHPDLKRKVDASLGLVDASVKSVRSIAARLRPRILDELGLLSAIDWLVQDFRERSGIDSAFVADAKVGTLSPERSTAVFRIVQEALSNIARHANAKCIDVSLHEEDGWLTLEVRDDGKGVTEDEKTGYESIGLLGMRERALAAGGTLVFDSVLGRGTVVTLRLPIAESLA